MNELAAANQEIRRLNDEINALRASLERISQMAKEKLPLLKGDPRDVIEAGSELIHILHEAQRGLTKGS